MDAYMKEIVERLVETSTELALYKEREKIVLKALWAAEIDKAREYERYEGKYSISLDEARIDTSVIRDIYGIMPCPEAISIIKSVKGVEE